MTPVSLLSRPAVALGLSIFSALLQIAIFPRLQMSWLAFVCFVPLLVLVPYHTPGKLFGYFFLSGVVFHSGNLYWIVHVIQHYTSLNTALSVAIVLLLCLILSLFWALFGLILGKFTRRTNLQNAMLVAPFLWISLEWSRIYLTQFPWCFLGYSQFNHLRLAQVATFFGVFGLSCLIMAMNASISLLILQRKSKYFASVLLILLVAAIYGNYRIQQNVVGEPLKVGCIQGNVPQDQKLSYQFADEINSRHLKMTQDLIDSDHPDIVFWSESSTLFPLRTGGDWTNQILSLARRTRTPLMIGSDDMQGNEIYNSAFFVNSNGSIELDYDKMYLVPFGEFVPFKSILFFAGKVVPEISDFSPGKDYTTFPLKGQRFGVHICFEVVFPQLSRALCRNGATLLTTITNDAWFARTAAPHQHFAMAVMRAIENRRYMVRCANTGISGIVDPYGRILQATDLFVPAIVTGEVKWIAEQTFYTRHGDLLIYAAIFVCLAAWIRISISQKKVIFRDKGK